MSPATGFFTRPPRPAALRRGVPSTRTTQAAAPRTPPPPPAPAAAHRRGREPAPRPRAPPPLAAALDHGSGEPVGEPARRQRLEQVLLRREPLRERRLPVLQVLAEEWALGHRRGIDRPDEAPVADQVGGEQLRAVRGDAVAEE